MNWNRVAAVALTITFGMCSDAAALTACRSAKAGTDYWSWRIIDGKRCWYRGARGLNKAKLYWPAAASARTKPRSHAPVRQRPAPAAMPADEVQPADCCWPALDRDSFTDRWDGIKGTTGTGGR